VRSSQCFVIKSLLFAHRYFYCCYYHQIEDLVRVAAPHEIDNIDMMMKQFEGREEELVQTLQEMHAKKKNGQNVEPDDSYSGSGSEEYSDGLYSDEDVSQKFAAADYRKWFPSHFSSCSFAT